MGLHNELQSEIDVSVGINTGSYASGAEFGESPSPARALEWYEPPALTMDQSGMIQTCNESCEELFGCRSLDLADQHVSCLFPQLTGHTLMMDGRLNPMLDFLCHCGHHFHTQDRQGRTFASALNFVRIEHGGRRSLRVIVRPLKNEPAMEHRERANREQTI